MIVLRDSKSIELIPFAQIREFVQARFQLLSEGGDVGSDEQVVFIVIEVGDLADEVEATTGCPLLTSLFSDAHFGDDDFAPMFEYVEDQGSFYEMVYIFNDSGFAHVVLVPKLSGIDPRLVQLCAEYV